MVGLNSIFLTPKQEQSRSLYFPRSEHPHGCDTNTEGEGNGVGAPLTPTGDVSIREDANH